MRTLDFSSWQAVLTTFFGPAIFTLVGVGIHVLMMQTVQQPRERMNRQINERLRTLIAAGGGGVGMSSGHRGDEHEAGDAPA